MFFEGDLQTGIAKDNAEESQQWEDEFLQETSAGSTEAGYLAAIYPLPKTPTLVIIKNGELKEYLAAGISKDDFLSRLVKIFASNASQGAPVSAQAMSSASSSQSPAAVASTGTTQQESASNITSEPSTPPSNPSNTTVQTLLAERSARLEAQRKEQDAKDKAKREAEAAERKKKLDEAAVPGSAASANMKYALMQKKRQQEAKAERARILKLVEDDKAARRARSAQQKSQAQAVAKPQSTEAGPSSVKTSSKGSSNECALQIRLFDGSTIRSRFPSQATIYNDVRPWIDEQQPSDQPYTFKHVLTPLPNKNIETSEEERSLESLDLAPSATLILLPVTGYTSAYTGNNGIVSTGVGIVSSGIGMANKVFGGIFGSAAPVPAQDTTSIAAAPSSNINVRTLRDQEKKKDDQQFYNGNALNFEPRKDEGDRKDD